MIASLFSKTRPINYVIVGLGLLLPYILYKYIDIVDAVSINLIVKESFIFLIIGVSFFLVNFISLRNSLTKNDNYAILIYLIFILLFPNILSNTTVLISNLFLLLALRRLISLKTLSSPKEKIFDASFWILLSAIFHFWTIVYIVLVFISIIFHSGKDYRNWLIPFISIFCVSILYIFFSLFLNNNFSFDIVQQSQVSFDFTKFENIYQNIALAIYASTALLFFVSQIFDYQNKPLNMQSSYKQVYFAFILASGIYLLSNNKSNDLLIYSFAPLSILGANMFEKMEDNKFKDGFLFLLLVVGIVFYVLQLLLKFNSIG